MDTDTLAKLIWDYHHVEHDLTQTDVIFGLGSHDLDVARYASELFLEGYAPLLAFSGGIAHLDDALRTGWDKTEAEMFADVAISMGVPKEKILLEDRATNTGENFTLTEDVFKANGLDPKSVMLVQKPYMERRALAAGLRHWPLRRLIVASRPVSYEEYTNGDIPKDTIIDIMVGDLQRIRLYGENGFQVPQEIPDEVWDAYERLVERGYTGHLVKA